MFKIFFSLCLTLLCLISSANELIKYYNGETKLSPAEIRILCEKIQKAPASNYLLALANYQMGVLFRQDNRNFDAFEMYNRALSDLLRSDTTDVYLHSAILRNQGVILKKFGLLSEAVEKQKEAIPLAYQYNKARGISTKYNLGRVLSNIDPEKALSVFLEALEEARNEGLKNQEARINNEIGLLFVENQEYEEARSYFSEAQRIAKDDKVKAQALHNHSHSFYSVKDYNEQEKWLLQSLELRKDVDRFISLMDLGECYLNKNQINLALEPLFEAEQLYGKLILDRENIKVFEWLIMATKDSAKYAYLGLVEYKKLADEKEKLESLLKKQAMQNLVKKLEAEEEKREKVSVYQAWVIIGFALVLFIFMFWKYRKYTIRKSVEEDLINLKIVDGQKKSL